MVPIFGKCIFFLNKPGHLLPEILSPKPHVIPNFVGAKYSRRHCYLNTTPNFSLRFVFHFFLHKSYETQDKQYVSFWSEQRPFPRRLCLRHLRPTASIRRPRHWSRWENKPRRSPHFLFWVLQRRGKRRRYRVDDDGRRHQQGRVRGVRGIRARAVGKRDGETTVGFWGYGRENKYLGYYPL